MTEDQRHAIKTISGLLMHALPATPIPGEEIFLPINGGTVWVGQTTTYTLGLMLSGMLLEDQDVD